MKLDCIGRLIGISEHLIPEGTIYRSSLGGRLKEQTAPETAPWWGMRFSTKSGRVAKLALTGFSERTLS